MTYLLLIPGGIIHVEGKLKGLHEEEENTTTGEH
jgi:hypothetical protein